MTQLGTSTLWEGKDYSLSFFLALLCACQSYAITTPKWLLLSENKKGTSLILSPKVTVLLHTDPWASASGWAWAKLVGGSASCN